MLTHERGGDRWVLKSPQHLSCFPVLAEVFPDATFVVTHRDPVAVTLSMATMVAYSCRMNLAHPDPMALGAYWRDRVQDLLADCVRDREALPGRPDRSMSASTSSWPTTWPWSSASTPSPTSPGTTGPGPRSSGYLASHPRGRHGGVRYDFAVLGLDRAELEQSLGFYTDRFLA